MKPFLSPLAVAVAAGLSLLAGVARGEAVNATFNSVATVPVTAATYTAAGNTVNLALTFAPPVGTDLTVVRNTGPAAIEGTFDNLPQWARVRLVHGGKTYTFVANYRGGTGNDLVLQWGDVRLLAWGYPGMLGNGSSSSTVPVPADLSGVLSGRSVAALAAGFSANLAPCTDGALAVWGSNAYGSYGNGTTGATYLPGLVDQSGVLAGQTIVAMANGYGHSVVLGDDGGLFSWGWNSVGQLGNGGTTQIPVPGSVDRSGVLAGKTVVTVAAGYNSSYALCTDGTLAAWGGNSSGQLGDGSLTDRWVPVAVDRSGVLAGKTISRLAAGYNHVLALCADGSLVAWGRNELGQLGNDSLVFSATPVAVELRGALAGRTVTGIAAGAAFSLALCADGALVAWGRNESGQLGNSSTTPSALPVLVDRSGVLAGKAVATIACGTFHSLVRCTDGTLATWGNNAYGNLGNNTTVNSSMPVAVVASALKTGERIVAGVTAATAMHNVAVVATPPPAIAATLAASALGDTAVQLNGSVNANGNSTTVAFEYGPTTAYGTTISGTPSPVTGTSAVPTSAAVGGLLPGTTYHFRVVATNSVGTIYGEDVAFTTTTHTTLAGLTLSAGVVEPGLSPINTSYLATVPNASAQITVTPVTASPTATVTVNGQPVASGSASAPLSLGVGANSITIVVTAAGGAAPRTYTLGVTRLPAVLTFGSPTAVPVSVGDFVATGCTVEFSLGHPPTPGADLTAVRNTGTNPIYGTFANLTQAQEVALNYGGGTYHYVADYFGGTGNDLVLRWRDQGLVAWGGNESGQLGNGGTDDVNAPAPVNPGGVPTGKTLRAVGTGSGHSVALTVDGSLFAWGSNGSGQLGNNSPAASSGPVPVDQTGVLAGKLVVGLAVGSGHTLVLCADGTMAAWGYNSNGQLGNGTTTLSRVPVAVNQTGVLAGKRVVAVAAGADSSFAICADGSAAAWGANVWRQLGVAGSLYNTSSPVLVDRSGVLAGKSITAVAVGYDQTLFLCADGTLAACGTNTSGGLGNNSTVSSGTPVLVSRAGVLAGKTVTAIAAGTASYALCADGTLAAWGYNYHGQLGIGTTTNSTVPVLVSKTGGLSGKTVTAITAGFYHGLAQCADGALAAWGGNPNGQLGNNGTANSTTPVVVNTTQPKRGERAMAVSSGPQAKHSLAVMAWRTPPAATTLAATGVGGAGATLAGRVKANGTSTGVTFRYGLTAAYGGTLAAVPATVSGGAETAVSAALGGLLPGTTYHFRVVADNGVATVTGEDLTFTTGSESALAGLGLSAGTLTPAFASNQLTYLATVPNAVESISLTPVCHDAAASVTVNGVAVPAGTAGVPVSLPVGSTTIPIVVTAAGGSGTLTYTVTVTRLPAVLAFPSPTTVPVTAAAFAAGGVAVELGLGFAPVAGTDLTVVNNTGPAFIQGTFDNLAHGQRVLLGYGGTSYEYVANYFGGTGNDLVLQWANCRLLTWGANTSGQLADGTTTSRSVPVAVEAGGVLAEKTILAVAVGGAHSLALCADGSLVAWGANGSGQLGNNSGAANYRPVAVDQSGVLAGRTVVAVAAGGNHCLALCADGTLAAWGSNSSGQLGNNSKTNTPVPVAVEQTGVLAGRTVIAIAAGSAFSMALCTDGTVATWGGAALGNAEVTVSRVPVAVNIAGVLANRQVVAIAAGGYHALALCADGALAAWGDNNSGRLGNNSTTFSTVPVLVDRSGVLANKTVARIAAGGDFSLGWCTDGTIALWGNNASGQAGIGVTTSTVPALLSRGGVLINKTIATMALGAVHSLAGCTDGTVAAWGSNYNGELGNNTTTASTTPVAVNAGALRAGERLAKVLTGATASFSVALAAAPPAPLVTTLAATAVTDATATLQGSINANNTSASVAFEYGPTTAYGTAVAATPAAVSGTTTTPVTAALTGLPPGTTFHYRVVVTHAAGVTTGADLTFTTTAAATLADLTVSEGSLSPAFDPARAGYSMVVPNATSSITVTPTAAVASAVVRVNGTVVAAGTPGAALPLAVGNTPVTIVVAAADGINTLTYTVTVTRLPAVYSFASAATVPVTTAEFDATGLAASFALTYAPAVGTNLTVVNHTGTNPIRGAFANLAQGQQVAITHNGITYPFVANYRGGTGNDLVLQWGTVRLLGWGYNSNDQLGLGSTTQQAAPVAAGVTGALAGMTPLAIATGGSSSWVLDVSGALPGMGSLGSAAQGNVGALLGKPVTQVAAGTAHTVALAEDGTLANWGVNNYGQLGGGTTNRPLPVAVDGSGVLAGRTLTAIASGTYHNLALCADGALIAWGSNINGRLGTGGTGSITVPVLVDRTGVLAGKTITAVAAGGDFSLALCADGTVAAWGANASGQLGNNSTTDSAVPVLVNTAGVLSGRKVVAVDAGQSHCIALCADGRLVTWGSNTAGQLGNNSTTQSSVPVLVTTSGILSGRTVSRVTAGLRHCVVLCADGTLASWGQNTFGELGLGTTGNSLVPAAIPTSALRAGERVLEVVSSADSFHNLARVAAPPAPGATTEPATVIGAAGATLNGSVKANGNSTSISFQYGLTAAYGNTATATPATATGTALTSTKAVLTGLAADTIYHYRVVATSAGGTVTGEDQVFATTAPAALAGLGMSAGPLVPGFASPVTAYFATVPAGTGQFTVTPVAAAAGAAVTVNGTPVASGAASAPIPLEDGANPVAVAVTAADGVTTRTYTVTVTRLPAACSFASAAAVPVTAAGFAATGDVPPIALGFAPPVGTTLTLVDNTGAAPIHGQFTNLAHGQTVELTYGNVTYAFIADYRGGTGNDLVLRWANLRLYGWGSNAGGQLGLPLTTTRASAAVAVPLPAGLAERIPLAVAVGDGHSLAVFADGTLAAWGKNTYGQLGNSSLTDSIEPVPVDRTGVLAGKTVVAVAAGSNHSLALCADGTLAAWGRNNFQQLGNDSTTDSTIPVPVRLAVALPGQTVIAIAAGESHCLALCADGTVAAWGSGANGKLGTGGTTTIGHPVAVTATGVLAGKRVVAIAAGISHSLALCADGSLAAWGFNSSGQLGNGTTTNSLVPALVTRTGVLAGKTPTGIAASGNHCLTWCADGTLAAWGGNPAGQLGNGTLTQSGVPVLVNRSGALAGRTVVELTAGSNHSQARCADGTMAAWGDNTNGQLGTGNLTASQVPTMVSWSASRPNDRFAECATGAAANHALALAALPLPSATTLAATGVTGSGATLQAGVFANGLATAVSFEYGTDTNYGAVVAGTPAAVSGESIVNATAAVAGLVPGQTYHFRVVATCRGGIARGADQVFTVAGHAPEFAGYAVSTPFQTATMVSLKKLLTKVTDQEGDAVGVTAAGPASARGGTAVLQAAGIFYTPPAGFTGVDTFPVTITDAGGAAVTGVVTVTVGPAATGGGLTPNPPLLRQLPDGRMSLRFQGIPGRAYQLQRSPDLITWTPLATITATETGALDFIDELPLEPNGYYRLAVP
jgi:alpha-tubulin suppressor-like RCC1 family protein/phosphodiesterase/alkaline phosphatase D-like protein